MTGFLLQLGAPLQSWGEHSAFTDRDTAAHPTRSGLIGIVASALGIPRAEAVADGVVDAGGGAGGGKAVLFARLTALRFTVRTDRPGTRLTDFHTVGGGYPQHLTVPTAKGGRRGADLATIVSRRHYLSDAVFTVAVTAPGQDGLLTRCAEALAAPRWPLHLGRRSCPPGALLVLRAGVPDPVAELGAVPSARTGGTVPLARAKPHRSGTAEDDGSEPTVLVRFTSDSPLACGPDSAPSGRDCVTTLNDEPVRLTARDRVHHARPSYTVSLPMPASLCGGYGSAYLDALDTYLKTSHTSASSSSRSDDA